ncbi:Hypothetical predicted protein [Lecanosticta acicola]|uniref:Uncharacterized protein n=1 Tax=Lecanosticta acicola TaxID=111012 RepID=A0AAI8Z7I5_9PEZI|nr:Hypothetical predicted protein [Lecanosticta acicola]
MSSSANRKKTASNAANTRATPNAANAKTASNASNSETTARTELEIAKSEYGKSLEDIGSAYNSLEERMHAVENSLPSKVQHLEQVMKPYEEHKRATQDALKKIYDLTQKLPRAEGNAELDELKKKVDGLVASDAKRALAIADMKRLHQASSSQAEYWAREHSKTQASRPDNEATSTQLWRLTKRVEALEGGEALSRNSAAENLTTAELVDALFDRIENDEGLDRATVSRLRSLTAGLTTSLTSGGAKGGLSQSTRAPYTPSSESERTVQTLDETAQESIRQMRALSAGQRKQKAAAAEANDSPAQRLRIRKEPDVNDESNQIRDGSAKRARSNHQAEAQDQNNTGYTVDANDMPSRRTRASKQAEIPRQADFPGMVQADSTPGYPTNFNHIRTSNNDRGQQPLAMPSMPPSGKRKRDDDADADAEPEDEADQPSQPKRAKKPLTGRRAETSSRQASMNNAAAAGGAQRANEVDEGTDDDEADDEHDGTQPRRTSRAPKPTRRSEQFMSWLEVKNRNKK